MEYKDFCESIAKRAGAIIKENFSKPMDKEWKSDDTPVTVTDTRTITGPPELVLPPPQQITPSSSEQSLDVTSETLEDNEPSLVYEKEEEPENKIIRTIKTVDDSKGLPLLAGIAEEEDDSKKSESDIKKVTTDNK